MSAGTYSAAEPGGTGHHEKSPAPMSRVVNPINIVLWIAFWALVLLDQDRLDRVWNAFRDWPLLLQIVVGFLCLPVVAATWIWRTDWALWLRIALDVVLFVSTVSAFSVDRRR